MKRRPIYRLILIFTLILVQILFSQNLEKILILHWNDFHSQNIPMRSICGDSTCYIGGTANLLGLINKFRNEEKNVLVLNAGDDFQGTPISSLTKGRSQIELMNLINPDAMTLGNHEFDYGRDALEENLKIAKFEVISANLWDKRKGKLFVKPYIVKKLGKAKIGVIGLITPELFKLSLKENLKDLELLNTERVLKQYINELKNKEKVDLIIALTHIGVNEDSILATKFPEIKIIIGGHSHTVLQEPKIVNNVIICQAGSRGEYLGYLEVSIDLDGDSVYSYKGKLIRVINGIVKPDETALKKVEELEKMVDKEFGQVIGKLEVDWKRNFYGESNLGNWEADVMREFAKTDIAFQNSGGLRKDLPKGDIKVRDIWEINPFGNTFVVFEVDGKTLKNMIEWQASGKAELMQVSGLKIVIDSRKNIGERVVSIEVGGKPLDENKIYSIVTNNWVADHLYDLFGIPQNSVKVKNLGVVDRDVFIEAVKKQKIIKSEVEGRIIDISKQRGEPNNEY
ncbi:bifunctional metallophosphatase/5'-nucleotidase [Candidatus Kryptobacter tengchongensis]|uniref:bifunctional metallophosphatase/5'-nucleotidase n=1 Tax=Kryptobacter tengchongensis TaxID=1643429 RepID=UPI0007082315|nr:bifunctional UDP-sugar hydrolase/5'-nucleotidase [Candidatus Kryptobacter tengchongensis]CUS90574.1 5'-nucleotidase [Candidatus Kryptobacter tengchongensis]